MLSEFRRDPTFLSRFPKCIDFPAANRYPTPNAKTASIRLVNRFGGNRQLSAAVLNTESGQLNKRGCPRRNIEMKKLMLVLIASACCTAFAMNASAQQADKAVADAVIAMVK